jgi:glycogen debranching enzyme
MAKNTVSILDGSTFVVSDFAGDIDAGPDTPHGLFFKDTRFISRWILTVDGSRPSVLSTDDLEYYAAQFFLTPPTGTIYRNPYLSVIRKRFVGEGFHEDVTVMNHDREPATLELRVECGADFADLFEVKDALVKKGELYRDVREVTQIPTPDPQPNGLQPPLELVFGYRREEFVREVLISSRAPITEIDGDTLVFRLTIPGRSEWSTCLAVRPVVDQVSVLKYGHGESAAKPNIGESLESWLERAPDLVTDWDDLHHLYRRSLVDLAALRFYPDIIPGASIPAAGLPWFMALFGRDSLITSYQALPFVPELAETTLRVLAARQGKAVDRYREEEPGKILHELRFGELTVFGERPHSPYYGTYDATPLFVILLDEVERWTGNSELARELEGPARAALTWLDEYGDRDGDGYVEYERNTESGLENQCWKDSWNSILHADGSISTTPRAICEIQGYVYDAKVRCARLAREVWGDAVLASRLELEAAALRERFNRDFWVADRSFFALALDGDKRQVDSLTSNIGHLLWSGIVNDDKASDLAEHLMSENLFSGWGVRTMALSEGGYNPIEYHNGTVWPHDNALIAAGLARYGYRKEATWIAAALIEAAGFFRYRLPEVFAGYERERTKVPVEYPTASSPQAWAAGTPLLLLRVLLGLEPVRSGLLVHAVLPGQVRQLELQGIPGRWGRADAIAEPVRIT